MNTPLEGISLRCRVPAYRFGRAGAIIAPDVSAPRAPDGDHRAPRPAPRRSAAGAGARRARCRAGGRGEPAVVVRRPRRAPARHRDRPRRPRAPRRMTALAAAAVWLQPVLLAALALRVAAGAPDAPWLALGALVAP